MPAYAYAYAYASAGAPPFGCFLAVHADWSMHPAKRWMSCAAWTGDGWLAEAPVIVGEISALLADLRDRAGQSRILFGIDCPLGLPRAYVELHLRDFAGFRDLLSRIERDSDLLRVCASLDELGPMRPFYPQHGTAGMSRKEHARALGLGSASDLSRLCDHATPTRPAGAPVLWTLGANQSGKAAIAAWRDLVMPQLREHPARIHLWPFDGDLRSWAATASGGDVLLAETYPAEVFDQLGLRLRTASGARGSKRRQSDRRAIASSVSSVLGRHGIDLTPAARMALIDGFGADPAGEDRFDSLLGLIGVVRVLSGAALDQIPSRDPWVANWEGWVFGLKPAN